MKRKMMSLLLALAVISGSSVYAKVIDVMSPNGAIKVSVDIKDRIYYSVSYDNDQLLKDCYLNLQLQNETLGTNPHLRSTKRGTIDESVKREIPFKNAIVRNHCNTLRMNFSGNYAVEFRVFDNGIAYRFVTDKKGDNIVMGEDFAINFPANYKAHLSQPDGFKTSYECPYTHVDTEKYAATDRMSYLPVLIETDKAYKILISEADLSDYPCMFLKSTGKNGMQSIFPVASRLPKKPITLPRRTASVHSPGA